MTVAELIKLLSKCPKDSLVIMAKDPEGNGFSPLSSVGTSNYLPANSWSGDIYSKDDFEDYGIDKKDCVPCVVFDPIN